MATQAMTCRKCRRVLFLSTHLEPSPHPAVARPADACTSYFLATPPPTWLLAAMTGLSEEELSREPPAGAKPTVSAAAALAAADKAKKAKAGKAKAKPKKRGGSDDFDDFDDFDDDEDGDEDDDAEEEDEEEDDDNAEGAIAVDENPTGGPNAGKLTCPGCSTKFGAFVWSGETCSCGAWVVPAIQVPKSKVDARVVPADRLPAIEKLLSSAAASTTR